MNINSNFHKEIDFKKPENVYQYIDNKLSLINSSKTNVTDFV